LHSQIKYNPVRKQGGKPVLMCKNGKNEMNKIVLIRNLVSVMPAFVFLSLMSPMAFAQEYYFPYKVRVESVAGQCYDDCWLIITMLDDQNNEIVVNPSTHSTVGAVSQPLYNIQYHYRNQNGGANTQYDTVGIIQLSAGTYCVGISASILITQGGNPIFIELDTTICNVEINTNYVHLEASILSGIAGNTDGNGREFCGIRNSFECASVGRIQLYLQKGNLPYHVCIYNEAHDTVRTATFSELVQHGEDIGYADYKDYYTFDSLPAGNYSIIVYDSCNYTLWLSTSIQAIEPSTLEMYCYSRNNIVDSNVINFPFIVHWNQNIYNYQHSYLDSLVQYRFINSGEDTTEWKNVPGSALGNTYFYALDTVFGAQNYCDIYYDSVTIQIRDHCLDTLFSKNFNFIPFFNYYLQEETVEETFNEHLTPDTCSIQANSGSITQAYSILWYYNYENYNSYNAHSQFYTGPLTLEIRNTIDNSLIVSSNANSLQELSATVVFYNDTTLPLQVVLYDAKGCVLYEMTHIYTTIVQPIQDLHYLYHTNSDFGSCSSRYLTVGEAEVDVEAFRDSVEVRLIDSPLYNKYNFTGTFSHGEWTYMMNDTANTTTTVEFNTGNGWNVTLRDNQLSPGLYQFVCTTQCGSDTIVIQNEGIYRAEVDFETLPQFDMTQVCDKLLVRPYGAVGKSDKYYISPNIDNDEPSMIHETFGVNYLVVNGMTGGFNPGLDNNGAFVFTVPGQYVIQSSFYSDCVIKYRYDTVVYEPVYIDFDMEYAVMCNNTESIGNVLTHAIQGSTPYTYYLYSAAELEGSLIASNNTGNFYDVPMMEGQMLSVLVVDSCMNSFYVNLVATRLSQSTLLWEVGASNDPVHCEGDSLRLSALPFSENVSYLWSGPNSFSSTSQNNIIYLPYGSESGWYKVTFLNIQCGIFSDSIYVEVHRAPVVTILSDTMICPGQSITLAFAVQGFGMVEYDILYYGALSSGIQHLTTQGGDTSLHDFQIDCDHVFWAQNIMDEQCRYGAGIDSTYVSIFGLENYSDTSNVTVVDDSACYNYEARLIASSNLQLPYYVYWYDSELQGNLLQCDTILEVTDVSAFVIPHLLEETTLYVTVANHNTCAPIWGTIYDVVNMTNGTSLLAGGEGVRFYDSGGENGNYSDNEHLTQTFSCPDRPRLYLYFNELNIAVGDTLFVYAGLTAHPDSMLLAFTGTNFPAQFIVENFAVTFVFSSNWTNQLSGWSIDILTNMSMTAVHANLIPPYLETIFLDVCQTKEPYHYPGFEPMNVSELGTFQVEKSFTSTIGCDSLVMLIVTVHPNYVTEFEDEICEGSAYHLHGFQIYPNETEGQSVIRRTAHYQSMYGCDSVCQLTLEIRDTSIYVQTSVDNFCDEYEMDIQVETSLGNIEWNTGETTHTIHIVEPGYYTVTAKDEHCSNTQRIFVKPCEFAIHLPNTITTSSKDGLNDYFCINEKQRIQISELEVYIYSRWGELVYSSKDLNFMWNGEINGRVFSGNVYVYVIFWTDRQNQEHLKKGSLITL